MRRPRAGARRRPGSAGGTGTGRRGEAQTDDEQRPGDHGRRAASACHGAGARATASHGAAPASSRSGPRVTSAPATSARRARAAEARRSSRSVLEVGGDDRGPADGGPDASGRRAARRRRASTSCGEPVGPARERAGLAAPSGRGCVTERPLSSASSPADQHDRRERRRRRAAARGPAAAAAASARRAVVQQGGPGGAVRPRPGQLARAAGRPGPSRRRPAGGTATTRAPSGHARARTVSAEPGQQRAGWRPSGRTRPAR